MEAYLRVYGRFEQNNWERWLPMTEFAYNNSWQASTMMGPFKELLSYHPQMSYKDNHEPRSKSRTANENVVVLFDLMKELKANVTELQELQMLYDSKHVKEHTCWPRGSV